MLTFFLINVCIYQKKVVPLHYRNKDNNNIQPSTSRLSLTLWQHQIASSVLPLDSKVSIVSAKSVTRQLPSTEVKILFQHLVITVRTSRFRKATLIGLLPGFSLRRTSSTQVRRPSGLTSTNPTTINLNSFNKQLSALDITVKSSLWQTTAFSQRTSIAKVSTSIVAMVTG